jgi:hypothetical protein
VNRITIAILLLAGLLASACATVGSVQNAPPDAGVVRVFEAPFDSTLAAAREAMGAARIRIESAREAEPGNWIIIGTTGPNFVSYGEIVRVSVARQEERKTRVIVYTRRRMATHVFAEDDYSGIIFSGMTRRLR